MHALHCLVIACLAAVGYGWPTTHIVGGEDAKIGEFPYTVFLRVNGKPWCGGSIIDRRHILTVAHCIVQFVDSPHDLSVSAGTNFLNETGDEYYVDKVIPHSDWDRRAVKNDIGLLRLDKDIQYKSTVKPIALADVKAAQGGEPCTISGWGNLKFMGKRPRNLQKLNLRVVEHTKCNQIWRKWGGVPKSQVCAFSQNGQGICHGDSGSPLVSKGVQIGIASYVRPCAVGIPDVYTRISAFKEWIDKHTKL